MPNRRRISFWIVAAATVIVDAFAIYRWSINERFPLADWYTVNVQTALAMGQLSAIGVAIVFAPRPRVGLYMLFIGALAAVSIVRLKLGVFAEFSVFDYACRTGLQVFIAMIVLWAVKCTAFWRWLAPDATHAKWEFSLRQMLAWTTATAVFCALVAKCSRSNGQLAPLTLALGILAPPAVTIGVTLFSQLNVLWLVRVIGYVALGSAVGTALAFYNRRELLTALNIEFIAEALVIAAWIELGGIVRPLIPQGKSETASEST